jgi:hypothetical protein
VLIQPYDTHTRAALAGAHHADLLREANGVRLGRVAAGDTSLRAGGSTLHPRLVAVAAALVIVLGLAAI